MNLPTVTYSPPTNRVAEYVEIIEFQQRAIAQRIASVERHNATLSTAMIGHAFSLLRGGTGLGKMFIDALSIRALLEQGKLIPPSGSINPFPVLWLCPKTAKPQTLKVLKDVGIADKVMVLTYGQIKNSDGVAIYLQYVTKMGHNGQPEIVALWHPHMLPALVVCDEAHKLKNPGSLVSRTIRGIPTNIMVWGASATPYQRCSDAYWMAERGLVTKYNCIPSSPNTAASIIRDIARPKHPDEYSPSACERLGDALEPYVVELKNVRFKHQSRTVCTTIYFKNEQQREIYNQAYIEYLEELRRAKREANHGRMAILVAMQKFQQKAELLRCDQLAERAVLAQQQGKQVIIASNYVETLTSTYKYLVHVHKIDPSRIATIVGGQTSNTRQKNVELFQTSKADFILFTMKSGGESISLHHDRDGSKPRHVILPPTWSAIDLAQALGRAHRLTSRSVTTQEVLWYGNTVEDRVKVRVELKVRCLAKAIKAKEQFMSIFENEVIAEDEDETYRELLDTRGESSDDNVDDTNEDEGITGEGLENTDDGGFSA